MISVFPFPRNAVFLSRKGQEPRSCSRAVGDPTGREGGNGENRRGITRPKGQVPRFRAHA
ncbi:hypothetical protein SS05631_d65520 (plasmid) [Sinorhizobium sp. CCBAU 05631]|nr:hypothetical protein SS05631_d65520 [Sinorhizobium sp. CCBAU 05631]